MKMRFFACENPRASHWQIGAQQGDCRVLLLGWRSTRTDADGGLEAAVAGVLAQALTAVGRVIFATGGDTLQVITNPSDESVDLSRTGLLARVSTALRSEPKSLALVGTSRTATVVHAFADATFSWELGVQRLLLGASASSRLPNREIWLQFMRDDAGAIRELVAQPETLGFMRPGVDGAVAALYSLTAATELAFVQALTGAASVAGASYELLAEAEFASALADARDPTR